MTTAYGRVSVMRRGEAVTIRNTHVQVTYDLNRGLWSYADASGHTLVQGIGARWSQPDGKERGTVDATTRAFHARPAQSERFGDGVEVLFTHRFEDDDTATILLVELYTDMPFALLRLRVANEGKRPFQVDRLEVIDVSPTSNDVTRGFFFGSDPAEYLFFLNGANSLARGIQSARRGQIFPDDLTREPVSDGIVFEPHSQRAVTFGFLGERRWWSGAQIGYEIHAADEELPETGGLNFWKVYQICDGARCTPGGYIETEPLYLNPATPASEGQRHFAETARAAETTVSLTPPSVTTYLHVEEGDPPTGQRIEAIIEWFENRRDELPLGEGGIYDIRLGCGWDGSSSEQFRQHFPGGVRSIVNRVHAVGLRIGAEVQTYIIEDEAPPEFREALITRRNGQPIAFSVGNLVDVRAFDPTHPLTQEYIIRRFEQVYLGWGFDALYTSLQPFRDLLTDDPSRYRWHEPGLTRMELLNRAARLLIEAKENVAPEGTLGLTETLPDGAFAGPYRSTVGLDAFYRSRAMLWDGQWGLRELLRAYTAKWYTRGHWWETELGPLRYIQGRPLNESHLLLTLGLLGGGHLTLADALPELDRDEIRLLSKCLPLMRGAARPIPIANTDLYAWTQPIRTPFDSWELLALVNLSDLYEDIDISFGDIGMSRSKTYVAYEFWDRVFFGIHQRTFSVLALPPRTAKLFVLREERPNPIFLASDLHISQGEEELLTVGWDGKSESLLGVCRGPKNGRGSLFFYVPETYVPVDVSCVGAKYSYTWEPPVYELQLALNEDPAPFAIRFARTSG